MSIYRKFLIIIANNVFRITLFFAISIVALSVLYTDRGYISKVLESNQAYERFVPSLLETNKNQSLNITNNITFNDPEIQEIINTAFPPEELRTHTSTVIDSVYDWLEQKQSTLSFTVDLSGSKTRLAEGFADYAINRLQNLPFCTQPSGETDPFSTDCKPEYISYELERQRLIQQLLSEQGFLDNPVFTESIIMSDRGEAFDGTYENLPMYYNLAKFSPLIVFLILTALALIIIFASSTKRRAYKKIGHNLIGAGASLIVFTFIFSYILPELTGSLPIFQTSGEGIDSLLNDVSINFGRDYSNMIIKISAPLIVIGAGLTIYASREKYSKDYKQVRTKSGISNSNEQKKKYQSKQGEKPPIQSSESSASKPVRKTKNKKYRKIPKKEV